MGALAVLAASALAARGGSQATPKSQTASTSAAPSGSATASRGPTHAFAYAPGTERYRITTVDTRTQDQSGGRAPMEFTTTTTQFVTVTLTRRAVDTVGLVLTLDSTQVSSTLDAPPPAMESFRGTRLQGTMSPQGRIYSFEPPAGVTDPTTVSLYRAFKHFLAPVPAEISQGTTWADSAIDSFERGHFNLKSSTVTTSKVTGDTTYLGQPAWRVERTGAITISGQGEGSNSGIRLAVDGTIRGTRYVSTSGVFLGATGTQTTHLAMTRPNAPGAQTAPIQESIKSTVAALPGPGSAGP